MDAVAALIILLVFCINVAAWVTNFFWTFSHFSSALTVETIVALLGILEVPLGIFHGFYLWL